MTHQPLSIVQPSYDSLLNDACSIIEEARHVAYRAINNTLTIRNWHLGERIAREELGGAQRAEYGKRVIEQLANDLTARYGKGYDRISLYNYVRFHQMFPQILDAVSQQSGIVDAVSQQFEVLPHVPDAKAFFEENLDAKKPVIKVGAEIPFTRYYYQYKAPTDSKVLADQFTSLETSVATRIAKLFGGDAQ